mgnify:CR=1 FL=1
MAILLAIALIWRPWRGFSLETRGIQYSADVSSGLRVMLKLEALHVTLRVENQESSNEIADLFEDSFLFIREIEPYDPATKLVTFEIGRITNLERVENIVDNRGEVISMKENVSDVTRDNVIGRLQARIDPYGIFGARSKPVGNNSALFEIAELEPERVRERLSRQGRFEAFIERTLVWRGDDIGEPIGASWYESEGAYVYRISFEISEEGGKNFEKVSMGKDNYPLPIYLDRPDDAIVVFDRRILEELPIGVTYDENERLFRYSGDTIGFELFDPPAVPTLTDSLPTETLQFLHEQRGVKTRVLLLGENKDFSENVIENIGTIYPIQNVPRITEPSTEPVDDWIRRAYGLASALRIPDETAGKEVSAWEILGEGRSEEDARAKAKDLEAILSQKLPVSTSIESEVEIEPRLGGEFMGEAIRAGLMALLGVGAFIYIRYRRFDVAAAMMGTMLADLIITLGIASLFGLRIGLPEIGGLIVVVGMGVDHQIIMTDEVLRGALPHAQRVSLKGRIGRVYPIIFAAAATTIAAMALLAYIGFGAMRGFALITIAGVLLAVILTRPVYARVLSLIMAREKPEITE